MPRRQTDPLPRHRSTPSGDAPDPRAFTQALGHVPPIMSKARPSHLCEAGPAWLSREAFAWLLRPLVVAGPPPRLPASTS